MKILVHFTLLPVDPIMVHRVQSCRSGQYLFYDTAWRNAMLLNTGEGKLNGFLILIISSVYSCWCSLGWYLIYSIDSSNQMWDYTKQPLPPIVGSWMVSTWSSSSWRWPSVKLSWSILSKPNSTTPQPNLNINCSWSCLCIDDNNNNKNNKNNRGLKEYQINFHRPRLSDELWLSTFILYECPKLPQYLWGTFYYLLFCCQVTSAEFPGGANCGVKLYNYPWYAPDNS